MIDQNKKRSLHDQLHDRRSRLSGAIAAAGAADDLVRLLQQVDAALERLDGETFGLCALCGESVDDELLLVNPLAAYCLCELTVAQQAALQRDLDLAWKVQAALLPQQGLTSGEWETHFRYVPVGPVSGDYCDLFASGDSTNDGSLYAFVGDVAGKGIAASLLMARLNALFRSLVRLELPLRELVERANSLFGESTLASHYATIASLRAGAGGSVEICNAGHPPPLIAGNGEIRAAGPSGFPLGMFGTTAYETERVVIEPGSTLLLYTDGLVEATDDRGNAYGTDRLSSIFESRRNDDLAMIARACLEDQASFRAGRPLADDLTVVLLRRIA